ncbi:MAG: DNA alkylation repair protein [Sphingobacteriales bacterium]
MTVQEIMTELEAMGNPGIKKILLNHGVKEPFFGVKIEHLKTIQKKVKTDYQLARDLYTTGNADAMYLAGLIADDMKMTEADLENWVKAAVSNNISEYTVPWVAAGSKLGFELGKKWIDSPEEYIAAAGWSTLGNWIAMKPDSEIDMTKIKTLMQRVEQNIHSAPNRVRYTMNGFIVSIGVYITALTEEAIATANRVGPVAVNVEGTACKVPFVVDYIKKAEARGSLGKKKKMVKC